MTLKNDFCKCSLFVLSGNRWKIKTWTLRFPTKENLNMEKALFDLPIVLQYDVKAKCRLISTKFFGHDVFSPERSLNEPKATRFCIRSTNQSSRSISVSLLFLFCSRVFISRSYENRSITWNPYRLLFWAPHYFMLRLKGLSENCALFHSCSNVVIAPDFNFSFIMILGRFSSQDEIFNCSLSF